MFRLVIPVFIGLVACQSRAPGPAPGPSPEPAASADESAARASTPSPVNGAADAALSKSPVTDKALSHAPIAEVETLLRQMDQGKEQPAQVRERFHRVIANARREFRARLNVKGAEAERLTRAFEAYVRERQRTFDERYRVYTKQFTERPKEKKPVLGE